MLRSREFPGNRAGGLSVDPGTRLEIEEVQAARIDLDLRLLPLPGPRAALDTGMVAEQLVKRGIADPRVLEAMRHTPRHLFVDEALRGQAYGDHPLPIGDGQTISQPFMVGRMTELLRLTGKEKVLEVGTGSGYQAAILARLAARVCTVERNPKLATRARQTLEAIGASNVWVRTANGTFGWPDEAPFDRIVVTAGGPA